MKEKKQLMTCKCESGIYSDSSILKNCKCKAVGRKERTYETLVIEGEK